MKSQQRSAMSAGSFIARMALMLGMGATEQGVKSPNPKGAFHGQPIFLQRHNRKLKGYQKQGLRSFNKNK